MWDEVEIVNELLGCPQFGTVVGDVLPGADMIEVLIDDGADMTEGVKLPLENLKKYQSASFAGLRKHKPQRSGTFLSQGRIGARCPGLEAGEHTANPLPWNISRLYPADRQMLDRRAKACTILQ